MLDTNILNHLTVFLQMSSGSLKCYLQTNRLQICVIYIYIYIYREREREREREDLVLNKLQGSITIKNLT